MILLWKIFYSLFGIGQLLWILPILLAGFADINYGMENYMYFTNSSLMVQGIGLGLLFGVLFFEKLTQQNPTKVIEN